MKRATARTQGLSISDPVGTLLPRPPMQRARQVLNASVEERPQWMRTVTLLYKNLGEDDVCSALRRRFAVCPDTKVTPDSWILEAMPLEAARGSRGTEACYWLVSRRV